MSGLQNYTLEQTAKILCCFPRFLEDNLAKLPHQKIGLAVAFDDEEIAAIKAMFRVRPAPAASSTAPPALAQIRPRGQRRTG